MIETSKGRIAASAPKSATIAIVISRDSDHAVKQPAWRFAIVERKIGDTGSGSWHTLPQLETTASAATGATAGTGTPAYGSSQPTLILSARAECG